VARVRAALQSVPCVRNTEVNFAQKEATVTADKATLDKPALLEALQKAGYEATITSERAP
jgi:copper chaperone CopZ